MNTPDQPISPTKKRQFTSFSRLLRGYSVIVAHYLNQFGISPQQVLFTRVIVLGGGSLFFFYSTNYFLNIIGLGLIALCYFFDLVDGDLARNHDKVTKLGGFLDGNFDAVVLNSIILTFAVSFLMHDLPVIFVIGGMLALFGTIFSSRMTVLFEETYGFDCTQGNALVEEYLESNSLDSTSQFIYCLITPKRFPMNLLSNFRDYLLVGVICGIEPIAILCFAIAINFRWIALFVTLAYYHHFLDTNQTRVKLFEFMKFAQTSHG